MIYLERVETEWPLRIQLPVGTTVPFYCTASGKMYLSTLPKAHLQRYATAEVLDAKTTNTITDPDALVREVTTVRSQGHAIDAEEFMDGMIAVAVPIFDGNDRLVATLSFHAPTIRFSIDKAIAFLPDLHAASAELSTLLQD
jgi:DNA-binding IclR family transcriptional regulator